MWSWRVLYVLISEMLRPEEDSHKPKLHNLRWQIQLHVQCAGDSFIYVGKAMLPQGNREETTGYHCLTAGDAQMDMTHSRGNTTLLWSTSLLFDLRFCGWKLRCFTASKKKKVNMHGGGSNGGGNHSSSLECIINTNRRWGGEPRLWTLQ